MHPQSSSEKSIFLDALEIESPGERTAFVESACQDNPDLPGEISNYAELARPGNVTRARVTQILNLLNLAPEIQERLLFLPRVEEGQDPLVLKELQGVARQTLRDNQRVETNQHLASSKDVRRPRLRQFSAGLAGVVWLDPSTRTRFISSTLIE